MTTEKMINPEQLVGASEIASRTGMSRQAVINWAKRYPDFPEPIAVVSRVKLYRWPDIRSWLQDHGWDYLIRTKINKT